MKIEILMIRFQNKFVFSRMLTGKSCEHRQITKKIFSFDVNFPTSEKVADVKLKFSLIQLFSSIYYNSYLI